MANLSPKKITAYFTHYPRIHDEIFLLAMTKHKTTSQIVVSLTALGLKTYLKKG
jgi:hypothetical protein